MTAESFSWDSEDQSVSWLYNGKAIMKKFENMHFASLNIEEDYVYVEAGENYSQDQIWYLSFDGELIFSYDKVKDQIRWRQNNQFIKVDCKHIVNAKFYVGFGVIIAITAINQVNRKMLGYALDGTFLFEKEPQEGYSFMYLSTSGNKPSVVCNGGKVNADAYGRSSWHFTINIKTGEISKGSLAY